MEVRGEFGRPYPDGRGELGARGRPHYGPARGELGDRRGDPDGRAFHDARG